MVYTETIVCPVNTCYSYPPRYGGYFFTLAPSDINSSFHLFLTYCLTYLSNDSISKVVTYFFDFNLTFLVCFRFILHAKKTGFVVEHDFIMATYLADRVVVFEGEPSVKTLANR